MMKFLKNIVNKLNTYIKTLILKPRNFVLGGGATTTTSENETCTELTMRLLFPEELNNANEDQSGGGLSTNPFEENPYTEHKESDTTDLIDFYERVEKDNLEYSKTMKALSKKADEILESINEHNDKSKAITKNIVEEKSKYDNILNDLSKFYEKVYGSFDKIVMVMSAIILLVIITKIILKIMDYRIAESSATAKIDESFSNVIGKAGSETVDVVKNVGKESNKVIDSISSKILKPTLTATGYGFKYLAFNKLLNTVYKMMKLFKR